MLSRSRVRRAPASFSADSPGAPSLIYVLPDKMGGMLNIVENLLAHRRDDTFAYHVLLTHNRLTRDTRFGDRLSADYQASFEYTLPLENLRAVLARLGRLIPAGPGVLVANDWIELALACVQDTGRTVIQILHGDQDYYYDLAAKHENVIHAFVTYGQVMYEKLRARLPHRADTIFHLPYGIPVPACVRRPAKGPLRLLYAGRLENGQKGVFDLPGIDHHLREMGSDTCWTVVGAGPDEAELQRRWDDQDGVRVQWLGVLKNAAVLDICAQHDVFVLPTRVEGVPVALVEAMGAGLVPVVSDLASGVREIVEDGVTGRCCPPGDIWAFAEAIAALARDRGRLEAMSAAARAAVMERFDIQERVAGYEQLYRRWRELHRPWPKDATLQYGSRLDVSWMPNPLVYAVRRTRRWLTARS